MKDFHKKKPAKSMENEFELARAYVRVQKYDKQYSPEDALMKGTIFPELYRPYPKCKKS
ncbi:MAG: spore coat associated protein CotJA [Halanaerobiales bacterium]|nr:spore coat associated protein CotJA [Halanaerobiales bacterium]